MLCCVERYYSKTFYTHNLFYCTTTLASDSEFFYLKYLNKWIREEEKILDKLIIERLSLSEWHPAGEMALVDAYKRETTTRIEW